jgi:transposase
MSLRTRIVPTNSGKHAVQVVSQVGKKLTVHKHIGTFATEEEKQVLNKKAQVYIQSNTGQQNALDYLSEQQFFDQIEITSSQPLFAYQLFSSLYDKLGFNAYDDGLIKDLVIARLYKPSSKLAAQEILSDSFNIEYSMRTIYRHMRSALKAGIQASYQQALVNFAHDTLGDELRLVFYDVSTLYFDSQLKTELKDFGFSKDHRPADTQVVIGLIVNKQGFPLYFDIFPGNSFEGHTFIPVVLKLKKLLKQPDLVVVADAGMLSRVNLADLDDAGIKFVIGARLANMPLKDIAVIASRLDKKSNTTIESTYHMPSGNYRLIASYSQKRADKDRHTRQKAVDRAQKIITSPATATSRYRFVKKSDDETKYELNQLLINKAEQLEGIKGYVTNTALEANIIMERYRDLWRIERAFRISKSDLMARPMYHKLDESIKAHVCLVFASLGITKYIELETGLSHKRVIAICSRLLTHTVVNTATGESQKKVTKLTNTDILVDLDKLNALL